MLALPRPSYDPGNRNTLRTLHWRDTATGKDARQRKVQNWQHWFRSDAGIYQPSAPVLREAPGAPYGWTGPFSYRWLQLDAPLQSYASDSPSGAVDGCRWGSRLSWRPDLWVNWQLVDVRPNVIPALRPQDNGVRWLNPIRNARLDVTLGRHVQRKAIRFRGEPDAWPRFAIRQGPGCTFEIVGGRSLRFLDAEGNQYMHTRPAFGWWGASDPDDLSAVAGRMQLVEEDPVRIQGEDWRTVRVQPIEEDFAGATFPLFVDPSTVISGTTDLEDSYMLTGNSNNYGGSTILYVRGNLDYSSLMRIATSALPADEMTGVRMTATAAFNNTSQAWFHRILPGNTWVEGSGTGTADAGTVSHNYRINTTDAWLGSVGCGTADTDYDSTAMGQSVPLAPSGATETFALSGGAEVFTNWRDGGYANEGILLRPVSGNPISWFRMYSTEDATRPWSVEVYYVSGGKRGHVTHAGDAFRDDLVRRVANPGHPHLDFLKGF